MRVFDWEHIKHFTKSEFDCKCGCRQNDMNLKFVMKLDAVREDSGIKMIVTSGDRCPLHNEAVGGIFNGDHPNHKGADIAVARKSAWLVCKYAMIHGLTVGVSQRKGKKRFLHLSLRDKRRTTLFSY